jgi:uncharacterized membrane protein
MSEPRTSATADADHTSDTTRLEAFSDGVFAFAITLLVIDLKVPGHELLESADGLFGALIGQWPSFLAYFMSFITIGIMWVNHHAIFHYIRRADRMLMLLHIGFLMLVAFVPFTTAVLADLLRGPVARDATLLYGGEFTDIATAYNAIWYYGIHDRHLRDPKLNEAGVRSISGRYRLGPMLYIVATGLATVSVTASLILHGALAGLFALPDRHRRPQGSPA